LTLLSVIVITKNEEGNIGGCLESVKWASEVVVVDGGSTDKTVEMATALGAKVFVRPWEGYGAAKNFALTQCSGQWILWLDADERVTKDLAEEIQALVHQGDSAFAGYNVSRKAFFLGRWIKHCGWYPGYVVRLFRRQAGKFTEEKVHERLEVSGRIGRLQSHLLHYTDPSLSHYFAKFNKYTSLAAEELTHQGQRFEIGQLIVRPIWVFFKMYVIRRGFLDGIQGFILCVLSSCYVFTKYAKLWELSADRERSNA
jgi:glycosyltransferase involved in cell wall biosynthesis